MRYTSEKNYKIFLWILFSLFLFRVLSQFTLQFIDIAFLPTFEKWHSNTLPYTVLFFFQILIIILYSRICIRVSKNTLKANANIGKFLRIFGTIYFLSMIIRYIISMIYYPELRWFGHIIPIFFHLVLSSFLIVLGKYHKFKLKNIQVWKK